jgi:hypothetical protein
LIVNLDIHRQFAHRCNQDLGYFGAAKFWGWRFATAEQLADFGT